MQRRHALALAVATAVAFGSLGAATASTDTARTVASGVTSAAKVDPYSDCLALAAREFAPEVCEPLAPGYVEGGNGLPPYFHRDAPVWCDEDMPCWIGSNADGRPDAEALADWTAQLHRLHDE